MTICYRVVSKQNIQILFAVCFALAVIVIFSEHININVEILKQGNFENRKKPSITELTNIKYGIINIREVESSQPQLPPQEGECIPRERILGKVEEENLINRTQYNVAFKLTRVKKGGFRIKRFRNLVISICNHSTVSLVFYLFMDSHARQISQEVFDEARLVCKCCFKVKHYNIKYLLTTQMETIDAIRAVTQNSLGMRRMRLFYLPIILHRFLPSFLDRMILFDSDFYFQSDIKQLFAHFDNFTDENCFGGVYVQQPTYRYACRKYRASHPDTKLGSPPPDGVPGYNGGLIMMHLKNLRKSKLYNLILTENRVKQYAEKYQFRNSLGEQDFFIMLDMEHHELFYVLPCSWNRQTTYYLGDRSYVSVYDLYHNCSEPIHAYHGNGGHKMPNE